jgi:hypothetical protein
VDPSRNRAKGKDLSGTAGSVNAASAQPKSGHLSVGRSSMAHNSAAAISNVGPAMGLPRSQGPSISSAAFCPVVSGKVTSMQWINESYEALLLVRCKVVDWLDHHLFCGVTFL